MNKKQQQPLTNEHLYENFNNSFELVAHAIDLAKGIMKRNANTDDVGATVSPVFTALDMIAQGEELAQEEEVEETQIAG